MEKLIKIFKYILSLMGGIAGLFGGYDTLLSVLLGAMVIDYLSGVIIAIHGKSPKSTDGKLSSLAGAKGIYKKVMIMLCVIIASLLDTALGEKNVFRTATLMFYIANESLSFIENLNIMGVPFPSFIKNIISEMQNKNKL